MAVPLGDRVRKRRDMLRACGLRPIQIWGPDARRRGCDDECRRQALIAATVDRADRQLRDFLDEALVDLAEPRE